MTFTAGQKLAASDLDQILTTVSQFIGGAQTTPTITHSGSTVDLTGTSVTFTTQYANTKYGLWGVFDVQGGASGTGVTFVGTAVLDGVTISAGQGLFSAAVGTRATIATNGIHTKWHVLVFGP
jgi:hypothetical protein